MQKATNRAPNSWSREGAVWAQRGSIAVASGDLTSARRCFASAVKHDGGNARYRFNLAIIQQAIGDVTRAAEQLTIALRLDGTMQNAAVRLCELLSQGVLKSAPNFDGAGLIAALQFRTIDRDLLCAAALHHLANVHPLRQILEHGRRDGWDSIARKLCIERTHDFLGNALFLEILEKGIVARYDIECLLTAIRRVLFLELPTDRLQDTSLCRFLIALLRQVRNNEYIWSRSDAETRRLDEICALRETPAADDAGDSPTLECLYRRDVIHSAVPVALRTTVDDQAAEDVVIRERAAGMPVFSETSGDVSRKVAGQYGSSPYPRWTSVPIFPQSGYIDHIKGNFKRGQLAFVEHPFEVLVAGCGTGQQAVSAAIDYGPNARVTGFDITGTSLGYASVMADRMGAANLTLGRGDLEAILAFEPGFVGRFHIIECGGVLHHMAEPFAAWKKLVACMAPGGIMLIGLYSSTARRHLQTLKREPGYPGASADDDALRTYRKSLFDRPGPWPGSEYLRSRDAYSLSGFRDFFLHVNEHTTDLIAIKTFLAENALEFRGFADLPIEALRRVKPNAVGPGDLADWSAFETAYPSAFAGMYQFWCTRV